MEDRVTPNPYEHFSPHELWLETANLFERFPTDSVDDYENTRDAQDKRLISDEFQQSAQKFDLLTQRMKITSYFKDTLSRLFTGAYLGGNATMLKDLILDKVGTNGMYDDRMAFRKERNYLIYWYLQVTAFQQKHPTAAGERELARLDAWRDEFHILQDGKIE